MVEQVVIGGSVGFAAAIQPGPLQAFFLSRVAADGRRTTLPAALAPLISDGPIAIVLLGTTSFLGARGRRALLLVSSVMLESIAMSSFWSAFR